MRTKFFTGVALVALVGTTAVLWAPWASSAPAPVGLRNDVRAGARPGALRGGDRQPLLPAPGGQDARLHRDEGREEPDRQGHGHGPDEGHPRHHDHGRARRGPPPRGPAGEDVRLLRAGRSGHRLVPGRGHDRVRAQRAHGHVRLVRGRGRRSPAGDHHGRQPADPRCLPAGVLRRTGGGHRVGRRDHRFVEGPLREGAARPHDAGVHTDRARRLRREGLRPGDRDRERARAHGRRTRSRSSSA